MDWFSAPYLKIDFIWVPGVPGGSLGSQRGPWDPRGVSPGDPRGPFGPIGPGPWADGPFGPIGPLDPGPWAQGPGTRNEYNVNGCKNNYLLYILYNIYNFYLKSKIDLKTPPYWSYDKTE